MIKSKFCLLAVMIFLALICGCAAFTQHGQAYKRAESCYNAGDFDGAVVNSIDSLSLKPDYREAMLLMKKAIPQAHERHDNRARELENSAEWGEAIMEYDALLEISRKVAESGIAYSIDTQIITQKKENAIQKAAEAHYRMGIQLMNSKSYNKSAKEFKRSQDFVPGYKDSELLYISCKEAAVRKVAIVMFENASGKFQFGDIEVKLTDQVIDAAINSNPELLVFITRDQIGQLIKEKRLSNTDDIRNNPIDAGKLLDIHAFVFGKIDSISVSHIPKISNTYGREVIVQRAESEGGSYKVSGKCTAYSKKCDVIVSAKYEIFSASSGTVVKTGALKKISSDEVSWAEFRGDERALNEENRELCSQKERELEPEEALAWRAIDELSADLAEELITFFEDFFK